MTSIFSNPLPVVESLAFTYICRECGHVVDREDLVSTVTSPDITPAANPKLLIRIGHPASETTTCREGQYRFLEAGSLGQLMIDVNIYLAQRFIPFGKIKWWETGLVNYNVATTETLYVTPSSVCLSLLFQNNGSDLTIILPDYVDVNKSTILEAREPYFLEIFIREHRNNCSVIIDTNPFSVYLETRDHYVRIAWTGTFFGWIVAGGNYLLSPP
jgi:hypothetical protein